jgi:PAS domain S-box-containing protein
MKTQAWSRFDPLPLYRGVHANRVMTCPLEGAGLLETKKRCIQEIMMTIHPATLMVVSPGRHIELCNRSIKRMFGYEIDEVVGRTTDLLYFDRRSDPHHQGELYEILEREGFHIGIATGKKRDAGLIPLEIITFKLRNRPGAILLVRDLSERLLTGSYGESQAEDFLEGSLGAYVSRLEDAVEDLRRQVEEQRSLQEQARRVNEALERRIQERTRALEAALEELKAVDKAKDDFLSLVSHEFRTPLTSIMSFSEILLNYQDEDPATRNEFLSIIHSESRRLTRLIDDMLDLSKIQAGKMEWKFRQGPLAPVFEKAARVAAGLLQQRSLRLEVDVEEGLPDVMIDEDKMVQVYINLLGNAIKFSPPGGVVRIAASLSRTAVPNGDRLGEVVHTSVSDQGTGIAPHDLQKIFEPFTQCGDTLKDKPKGTGLGLAICKQIVEAHRGAIWAESVVGQGSTFHVTLPAAGR